MKKMNNRGVRNTVFGLLLVIIVVLGATVMKFTGSQPELDKAELRELGLVWYATPRTFAFNPLTIAQETGEQKTVLSHADLVDQWTLMFFGFTFCPDVCPATMAHMAQMMRELRSRDPELAQRVDVVLVSVDPNRDSIEKLDNYAQFFDSEFVGATSDPANLKAMAQQLNVAYETVGDIATNNYLIEHSTHVVLVNPKGDYQGFLKPPFNAQHIAEALVKMDRAF